MRLTLRPQKPRFGVRKDNRPIADVQLQGGISTGITYNLSFSIWDAAIAAGAGIEDLWKLDQGLYPHSFVAKILAWHRGKIAIDNHTEAAKIKASKAK